MVVFLAYLLRLRDSSGALWVSGARQYTKSLTQIWHQIWDKNDGENIEIIFKSHEPFQSYKLIGPANWASKAG